MRSPATLVPPPPPSRELAFVVEDDEACRSLYTRALEAGGYRVLARPHADDLVELAAQKAPAAILVDISLPGTSGLTACEALKRDYRTADIPVVVLTGHASFEAMRRSTLAGADSFMVKPAKPSVVVETIRRLAKNKTPAR